MNASHSAFRNCACEQRSSRFLGKPAEINYSCRPPVGLNEAGIFLRREPLLALFVGPSAMTDDSAVSDRDPMRIDEPVPTPKCGKIGDRGGLSPVRLDESSIGLHVVALSHALFVRPAWVGL
jgi:hypothetical protein